MANGEIVRDEDGNAKGGVRTPYVDLPTVRYIASAPTDDPANMVRRMIGLQEAISAENLQRMYNSRAEYLTRFDQEIDRLVAQHWLLPKDGVQLKADEAKNPPLCRPAENLPRYANSSVIVRLVSIRPRTPLLHLDTHGLLHGEAQCG